MAEINPLLAYTCIFLVSLAGAYVTFGILESTATIKNEAVQLGGAAAGFIVIFSIFSKKYSAEMEKIRSQTNFLFSLVFPEEEILSINFNNKENGTYEIISKDQINKSGPLMLEFKPPGGWIWKPPVKIQPDSTIVLDLVEDDGDKWIVKETLQPTIPLHPRSRR